MSRTILAVVDDLFFASKIRGTGEQVGAQIIFVKSISAALGKAREISPSMVIADLNTGCCDVFELARALKADDVAGKIPVLGFFSHVQTEMQERALASGFDQVMPRSAFTKNLPGILSGPPA